MKTDADLKSYLTAAGGDMAKARIAAAQDHSPQDQTLESKWTQMEKLSKEVEE